MFDGAYVGRRLNDFVSEFAPYSRLSGLRISEPEEIDFGDRMMYIWQLIGEDEVNSSVGKVVYFFPVAGEIWADPSGNLKFRNIEETLEYLERDLVCDWDF
jgi:hypothetical protein